MDRILRIGLEYFEVLIRERIFTLSQRTQLGGEAFLTLVEHLTMKDCEP